MDKCYEDEQCISESQQIKNDDRIKNFIAILATNRLATESLNTKLGEVDLELKSKEEEIKRLITARSEN